ncbi:hypothetical protein TSUD_331170 [Trifolium subterraneum]|uniref:Uncharacterized protein n=1 Tax=Trifolium subterraneum TaxID=3900 RepID=A0A2Z6MWK5_TRISU|nr:hypothetical protein TSUD_331170 [Trifolium subterraneum]
MSYTPYVREASMPTVHDCTISKPLIDQCQIRLCFARGSEPFIWRFPLPFSALLFVGVLLGGGIHRLHCVGDSNDWQEMVC